MQPVSASGSTGSEPLLAFTIGPFGSPRRTERVFLYISLQGETAPDLNHIVGNHTEPHPALHAVESAVQAAHTRRTKSHSLTLTDPVLPSEAEEACVPYHPAFNPLFCSSNHFCNGAKYSSIAPASVCFSPVMASRATGQGLLCPISSIWLNLSPASFDP